MKTSHTGYWFRHFTAAALGSLLVIAATSASAQTTKSAPLNILLSGPGGEPSTLVYSPEAGWRLHEGWNMGDKQDEPSMKAAIAKQPAAAADGDLAERPLTVFVDGPTGFTYIYLFDKGWKFVGRVADEKR